MSLFSQILNGASQLLKGGPMLFPLVFLSLLAMAIVLERFQALRRDRYIPSEFIARIYRQLERGKYDLALALCESRPLLVTNLLRFGIERRHLDEKALLSEVRGYTQHHVRELYKNLFVLSLVATVAPLLGLLGTVLGMIQGFMALALEGGQVQMRIVADGISVALLTTFAGLVIAVPTLVAHQALLQRADMIANEVRRYGIALVRFLKTEEVRLFEASEEPEDYDWELRESSSSAS